MRLLKSSSHGRPQAQIKIEEADVKPDVEKLLKQQMQVVPLAEEEKPLLIEPPLEMPGKQTSEQAKPDTLLPTIDECKQALATTEEIIDDRESVRTFDDDGTHRWCYVCNDYKEDRAEEEKEICTTCPRVFHKSCSIPQIAWSEEENWQCVFCKTAPIKTEDESKMTPRNRFLCQTVLMKCFGTRRAFYLMSSYADPEKTLEVVGHRLEEDHPMSFKIVDEFIEALNNVLINASIYNSAASEKGKATRKVWMLYRKAVKDYLPEFVGVVWIYISLYGCSLKKRRSSKTSVFDEGIKRRRST